MKNTIVSILVFCISMSVFAQNKDSDKVRYKLQFNQAYKSFTDQDLFEALQIFKELSADNPNLPFIQYWYGRTLLRTGNDYNTALRLLQLACIEVDVTVLESDAENDKAPLDAMLKLARVQQCLGDYNAALQTFMSLKSLVAQNLPFQEKYETALKQYQHAQEFNKIADDYNVLPCKVSSPALETSVCLTANAKEMYWVSRKQEKGKIISENKIAGRKDDAYKEIGNLNIDGEICGISVDGQLALIVIDGQLYQMRQDQGKWLKPELLPETINSKAIQRDAVLAADGRELYFSSNREGGFGGFDLYYSRHDLTGNWMPAENLGSDVNTPADEIMPFIHADYNTLYFASQGHRNMGGFDIFESKRDEEGLWSYTDNAGVPINSPADDYGFQVLPNYQEAFFISNRPGGSGFTDIYRIQDFKGRDPAENMVLVQGKVSFWDEAPLNNVQITITDIDRDDVIGVYAPNKLTGKFLFILSPNISYSALYEAEGYISYTDNFTLNADSAYRQLLRPVELREVRFFNPPSGFVTKGETHIDNLFFDVNSTDISSYSETLDLLADYLRKNPNAIVEVAAHSDAENDEAYNLELTQKRANAVKKYLVDSKVNPNQVVAKGYGESHPVARNYTPGGAPDLEGRRYNRRLEFRILSKGRQALVIKSIEVPVHLQKK